MFIASSRLGRVCLSSVMSPPPRGDLVLSFVRVLRQITLIIWLFRHRPSLCGLRPVEGHSNYSLITTQPVLTEPDVDGT